MLQFMAVDSLLAINVSIKLLEAQMNLDVFCNIFSAKDANQVAMLEKISNEFRDKFDSTFNKEFVGQFSSCPTKIIFIINFDKKKSKPKNSATYDPVADEVILEMFFVTEEYADLYPAEFRHRLSHLIFDFFSKNLVDLNLPKLNAGDFLSKMKIEMEDIHWLGDEVDYSFE